MLALVVCLAGIAAPARAQTPATTAPAAPPPPPKAWILVDADTGAVLDAHNDREPLPPSSLSKIFTALATVNALPLDAEVPVTARAEGAPARKINMKAGQVWALADVLDALLLSSANDAAMALAERVAGSGEAFAGHLDEVARRLRLDDAPVLQDPAGLDDEFSIGGGNRVSARDLAITARAVLDHPLLGAIVGTREARFHGGDNIDHKLINHNRLLRTYPGTIGVKTGYTKRSGHCLIAAARRDGRTMLAVVLHAADMYGSATSLMDRGFATPLRDQRSARRLPTPASHKAPVEIRSATQMPVAAALAPPSQGDRRSRRAISLILGAGVAWTFVLLRARAVLRSNRRRRRRELQTR